MYMDMRKLNNEQLLILELLYNLRHKNLAKKDSDRLAAYQELDPDLEKSFDHGYIFSRMLFNLMRTNHAFTISPATFKKNLLQLADDSLVTPLFSSKNAKINAEAQKSHIETYLKTIGNNDFGWDSVVAITSKGENTIKDIRFIKSLIVVKTTAATYLVIVNADYGRSPLEMRKSFPKWDMFYKLAVSPHHEIPFNKDFLDYMNYRSENPLYARTKLSRTKVVKQAGNKIKPAVEIENISEAAYKRRKSLA